MFIAISSNLRFHFHNISSLSCIKSEIHYLDVMNTGEINQQSKTKKKFFFLNIRLIESFKSVSQMLLGPKREATLLCYILSTKFLCQR